MDFNHERSFLFFSASRCPRPRQPRIGSSNLRTSRSEEGSRVDTGEQHRLFGASHLNTGSRVQLHGSTAITPEHAGGTVSGHHFYRQGGG